MRYFVALFVCIFSFFSSLRAQDDYLQVVSLEADRGLQGVFHSAGVSDEKKGVEINAIKSLFYTLFFQGVEGVNDGQPLVCHPNEMYTKTFFNASARYAAYVVNVEEVVKPKKIAGRYQGTMAITVKLRQLVNDVKKNTRCDEVKVETPKTKIAKPTIIVVPYAREGESFQAIIENENNSDQMIAVGAVEEGLLENDIEIRSLKGVLEGRKRQALYDTRSNTSNEKELLRSSGADVYIEVKMEPHITAEGTSVSLDLTARQTGTGIEWAKKVGTSNKFRTSDVKRLCQFVVKDNLPSFINQIIDRYMQPTRITLDIYTNGPSLMDACKTGRRIIDEIKRWLAKNAHEGDYKAAGTNADYTRFDYIVIPSHDKEGIKMDAGMFLGEMAAFLKTIGVSVDTGSIIDEGNIMQMTLTESEDY